MRRIEARDDGGASAGGRREQDVSPQHAAGRIVKHVALETLPLVLHVTNMLTVLLNKHAFEFAVYCILILHLQMA